MSDLVRAAVIQTAPVLLDREATVGKVCQFVTREMMPADWEDIGPGPADFCRGGSAILDPFGRYLAGPLYGQEGILSAELDLSLIPQARFDLDVVGHYSRPDVFQLTINEGP